MPKGVFRVNHHLSTLCLTIGNLRMQKNSVEKPWFVLTNVVLGIESHLVFLNAFFKKKSTFSWTAPMHVQSGFHWDEEWFYIPTFVFLSLKKAIRKIRVCVLFTTSGCFSSLKPDLEQRSFGLVPPRAGEESTCSSVQASASGVLQCSARYVLLFS